MSSSVEIDENDSRNALTYSFKTMLKSYLSYDDQIPQADKSLRVIKKKRDELKIQMYQHMRNHNLDEISLNEQGTIKTFISKTTGSLNKAWIYKRCLLLFDGDEKKAEEVTNFIADPKHRPKKEKHTIKRLRPRKKKVEKKN